MYVYVVKPKQECNAALYKRTDMHLTKRYIILLDRHDKNKETGHAELLKYFDPG